ncbi:MAG: TIGR00375 family protein [Methanosarcinales archaeon]|nr:MAG: TIGR00375 family protein [Methanosarcinales archaeon]
MHVNADLHIHSKYSAATSARMDLPTLTREAAKKGIGLIGTGDCLHPKWLSDIKVLKPVDEGTFVANDTRFVLTCEIEDSARVHHLLILPSISKAEELQERLASFSNLASDGRPKVRLNGKQLAQHAKDVGALFGPAHAFTPWTAMYAYFDSLIDCYGPMASHVAFIELGLSADSDYADRIAELQNLTFLTNSDAHSPWPIRLAREFNRFEMGAPTFEELKQAILRKNGRKPILNVGLPPEEGKYNESACIRCYKHYSLQICQERKWRCTCGGLIKKGVRDRVSELADYEKPRHPQHRPPYLRLIPLAEIIALALGVSDSNTKAVRDVWGTMVSALGNEVTILVDADIGQLNMVDESVREAILAFREGRIILHPGGGGQYGRVELPQGFRAQSKSQCSLSNFL